MSRGIKLKPFQLVWIEQPSEFAEGDKIRYVGEVMSFPFVEDDIGYVMARRVPGHPGTLERVPVTTIASVDTDNLRHVAYAQVKGIGAFPVDMLRFDNAQPVNFRIVPSDTALCGYRLEMIPEFVAGDELLVAKAFQGPLSAAFTKERWRSFLWNVGDVRALPIVEETR